MDESIERLVRANRGYFTRGEAVAVGFSDDDLWEAVRSKAIIRLRRGAYAPRDLYLECDDLGRHVLLARAVVAAQRGTVALTGPSAAAVHGFTLYGHDLSKVHLVRLDGGSARHEANVIHHRVSAELEESLVSKSGLHLVNPARTVWEVGVVSDLESGVVTADSALRLYPELMGEIKEMADIYEHRPGSRTARMALRMANGRSESPGESISRVKFHRYALPIPDLQFEVFDSSGRFVGRSDFGWEGYRHLGEFDGKIKYGALLKPDETGSDVVFREKRREDQLRSCLWGMSRLTWYDLDASRARSTVARIRQELEQSRRLYTRDRRYFVS